MEVYSGEASRVSLAAGPKALEAAEFEIPEFKAPEWSAVGKAVVLTADLSDQ
jgi:hypothetical protein